ncbi:MAG: GNAT family N-acetyltransferase [Eubacteriales bacterium]
MNAGFLIGNKINLRKLTIVDATEEYLSWLNNYEVVKYTESRFFPQSIKEIERYIENCNNFNNVTFAIIDNEQKTHIGNIKLGDINWIHRYADIGLIVGNSTFWGRGIATEAIGLVADYGFKQLNLRKIVAGVYSKNIASQKAFEKNGFSISYKEKEKYFFEGEYIDGIVLEKCASYLCKGVE